MTETQHLVADAAGQWKFWPCYTLILPGENEDEKYCPSQWESSFVEVVK